MSGRNGEAKLTGDLKLAEMARDGRLISFPLLLPSAAERREARSSNQSARGRGEGDPNPQERRARGDSWRDKISSITAKRFRHEAKKMKSLPQLIELLGDIGFTIAVILALSPTIRMFFIGWLR